MPRVYKFSCQRQDENFLQISPSSAGPGEAAKTPIKLCQPLTFISKLHFSPCHQKYFYRVQKFGLSNVSIDHDFYLALFLLDRNRLLLPQSVWIYSISIRLDPLSSNLCLVRSDFLNHLPCLFHCGCPLARSWGPHTAHTQPLILSTSVHLTFKFGILSDNNNWGDGPRFLNNLHWETLSSHHSIVNTIRDLFQVPLLLLLLLLMCGWYLFISRTAQNPAPRYWWWWWW